ncbi:hypothetical protein KKF91_15810 [Myxococcota bacterium]|nr:hypothetical protein [Myxococcota bacterium]MBU1432007.1 hypothetical protein [Myxococcota bacterium]MBU1896175.1 hypothetical protein [Myxococcota bacterium]
MQQQLAARFNEISQALTAQGDLVVIRKARQLIAAGEVGEAVAFLKSMGQQHGALNGLADALTRFAQRGDFQALLAEPAWRDGARLEDFTEAQIEAATQGDLSALVDELVQQTLNRHVPLRPDVILPLTPSAAPPPALDESPTAFDPVPPASPSQPSVAFPLDDEIIAPAPPSAELPIAAPFTLPSPPPSVEEDDLLEGSGGLLGPILALTLFIGTVVGLYFFLN